MNIRILFFQIFRHARQRAARADARDERVDLSIGIRPDFRPRVALVVGGIRGILELLRNERARILGLQLQRLFNGAFHALRAFRQDDFRAIGLGQFAAFNTHRLGHRQNQMIALHGRHEGQTDARVAACRFDDQRARFQFAFLLRRLDHGERDPVLHGTARIEGFHFHDDFRLAFVQFVDADQRRVPDLFKNV